MMDKPTDLTEREAWQWAEAAYCDRMVENYRGEMIDKWLEKGRHPDMLMGALRCAIAAQQWESMADHLRRPYYSRKEHEAYKAAGLV